MTDHNNTEMPGEEKEPSQDTEVGRIGSPQKYLHPNTRNL